MDGLDNSGKTLPVTAARKTDLWNVKKTRVRARSFAHSLSLSLLSQPGGTLIMYIFSRNF